MTLISLCRRVFFRWALFSKAPGAPLNRDNIVPTDVVSFAKAWVQDNALEVILWGDPVATCVRTAWVVLLWGAFGGLGWFWFGGPLWCL